MEENIYKNKWENKIIWYDINNKIYKQYLVNDDFYKNKRKLFIY